jgi:hypothetical protein
VTGQPFPVRTKALEGLAVRWDGSNEDELRALAARDFAGTHGRDALVRVIRGEVIPVHEGWYVARWDGAPGLVAYSPDAWDLEVEAA